MRSPNSGRQKYTGICDICSTQKTARWYRKAIPDKVICKSCYDKHRRAIPSIKILRAKQRSDWDLKYPYRRFLQLIKKNGNFTTLTEQEYLELKK